MKLVGVVLNCKPPVFGLDILFASRLWRRFSVHQLKLMTYGQPTRDIPRILYGSHICGIVRAVTMIKYTIQPITR